MHLARASVAAWAARLAAARVSEPAHSAAHLAVEATGGRVPFGRALAWAEGALADASPPRGGAEESLTPAERVAFDAMCERRLRHEPVQYIAGRWPFRDIEVAVRAPVLVPRPETEDLVGHVLRSVDTHAPLSLLDVGAGSGCIALALLAALPGATATAIDLSPHAVRLAMENAGRLGLSARYTALHACIRTWCHGAPFDVVVSNPPYIPTASMGDLMRDVREFEDPTALDGGGDGLDVARAILLRCAGMTVAGAASAGRAESAGSAGAAGLVRAGGSVWLELDGPEQCERLCTWAAQATPQLRPKTPCTDFAGVRRFATFMRNG